MCIYVYTNICVYVCIYIYIYIYMCLLLGVFSAFHTRLCLHVGVLRKQAARDSSIMFTILISSNIINRITIIIIIIIIMSYLYHYYD